MARKGATPEQATAQNDLRRRFGPGRKTSDVVADLKTYAWLAELRSRVSAANNCAWAEKKAEVTGVYNHPLGEKAADLLTPLVSEIIHAQDEIEARLLKDLNLKSTNGDIIIFEEQDPHPH